MSSTLKEQKNLSRVSDRAIASYLFTNTLKLKKIKVYALGRSPYSRLVSFYEDKFKCHPSWPDEIRKRFGDVRGWQKCQKIFFPYLKIKLDFKDEYISEILQNVSFEEFINLLPEVYHLDPHLELQEKNLRLNLNYAKNSIKFTINLKPDLLVKIDNPDNSSFLENLKLDLSIKKNSTNNGKKSYYDYFNFSLYTVVNQIYQADFELFNYSQKYS